MALAPSIYEENDSATISSAQIYHSSGTTGSTTIKKRSGICEFKWPALMANTITTTGSFVTLGFTIPDGFRPAQNVYISFNRGGNDYRVQFLTDGTIKVNCSQSTAAQSSWENTFHWIGA